METVRAFAALVCFAAACSSPDFSSVSDTPEPQAGKPGSAGGSGGKTGSSTGASGRGAAAGNGTVSHGGTTGAGGAVGAAAGDGGSGGDGATGASGGSGGSGSPTGGTDATGGSSSDGGSGGATGGATGTGGDLGTGGDAESGGTTGSTGGDGGSAGLGDAGAGGIGVGGIGIGGAGGAGTDGGAGTPGSGGVGGMPGGCDNQLLANADFEAGPTPSWLEESDKPGLEIIVPGGDVELMADGVSPYAGSYLAWLGGITDNMWDHYDVFLRQNVYIPEDASALTLSGFHHIQSDDSTTVANDVAYLEFETDAGTVWQAVHWTNVDETSGWQTFTSTTDDVDQVNALRGKTVTFVAYSRTDQLGKTSFFLDNLKLEAECGR